MVILVEGTALREPPRNIGWFYSQFPSLRDGAKGIKAEDTRQLTGRGTLYVSVREFAVTQSEDTKIAVVGTDTLINNAAVIIRNTGTGSLLVSHVDRLVSDDLTSMLHKLGTNGKLELHIIGAFADSMGISEALLVPILNTLHNSPEELELVTCCVGEACTVLRGTSAWPLVYGVGVNVKNGTIFPANFLDKGPDLDMRTARILTGGEKVGMLDIYSSEREELRVGPFSYLPMRSVDIWLDQSDDFILQSLTPCPEVVPDKSLFVRQVRDTLRLVKSHPYPSVTLFHSNAPRSYRKDDISGHWIPTGQSTGLYLPFPPQGCGKMEPQPAFHDDLCLNFKQENFLAWQGFAAESHVYY